MTTKTLFAAALALAFVAGPALAGPVGSGLGLTEDVARRAQQQRTVTVAAAGEACAARAQESLKAHPAVAGVSRSANEVRVTFRSAAHAVEHRSAVDAAVQACG